MKCKKVIDRKYSKIKVCARSCGCENNKVTINSSIEITTYLLNKVALNESHSKGGFTYGGVRFNNMQSRETQQCMIMQ
jgi:hypothetical protein